MKTCPGTSRPHSQEEGYVLIIALLAVAIFVISLAVALPKVKEAIQRDQEAETMHRGKQYIRAIQLYHRRFHAYPPSVDALVDTNGIRFLRKKYTDPITGRDDWLPVLLGQNKAPTAMGFFGQPLDAAEAALMGNGPASSLASGESPLGSGTGSTDNAGSNTSQSNGGSTANAGTGAAGQIIGGTGIIGFSPASPRQSIMVYKTKDHYSEWEFVYSPLADWGIRGQLPMLPPPGPPANSGSPGFNPGSAGANQTIGSPPSATATP